MELFMTAIIVGVGLTLGWFIGRMIASAIDGAVVSVLRKQSEKGNKVTQTICKLTHIGYEPMRNTDEREMKRIGF